MDFDTIRIQIVAVMCYWCIYDKIKFTIEAFIPKWILGEQTDMNNIETNRHFENV